MTLGLYWFKNNIEYKIATLERDNEKYILTIVENELKKAIKAGCLGIGNITFLQERYESKELFTFFKERIPSRNHPKINKILEELNLKEYDEMEILEKTNGIKHGDNYYLKKIIS